MQNVEFYNTAKIQGLIIHGVLTGQLRPVARRRAVLAKRNDGTFVSPLAPASDEVAVEDDDEDLIDGDDMGEERVEEIVDCGTPSQVSFRSSSLANSTFW